MFNWVWLGLGLVKQIEVKVSGFLYLGLGFKGFWVLGPIRVWEWVFG